MKYEIETEQIKLINAGSAPKFTVVEIQLLQPAIEVSALQELSDKFLLTPFVDTTKGVILDGRMPVWLAGYLVHEFHAVAWVAINDPRLGGVVVASHNPNYNVGQVIDWKSELYVV